MPKIPFWVFIVIAVLYFTSIRVDTMDVDASQYAEMSREMLHSHNWLQLYDRGQEYLDKPPFLFWVTALSMKVLGVNNLGYKLPSILFGLWAIFATYRLARLLYNDTTARMAALILATCQGMFLMTNDIRCDTILMSWVITAIWLIKEWDVQRKMGCLLGGFAAIGMGMMTKGPIALMVPIFCFASDWVLKREWRKFFHPGYLLGILIIALILVPMSIGLYQQFDLHPEKMVNGKTGVSGLRFFYWGQSFGRITGESPWKNGATIGFLLLNMLWSFLPWIFVFVPAVVMNVIKVIQQKLRLRADQEFITTGGFLLAYLALGSSAYQLPHYIFVVFPLAAIITAQAIAAAIEHNTMAGLFKLIRPLLFGISSILLLAVAILISYVFPSGVFAIVLWVVCMALWLYLAFSKMVAGKLLWLPAAAMIMANIFVTNYLYYTLLQYQVGSQVGRYIKEHDVSSVGFVMYKMDDPVNSINFYANKTLTATDTLIELTGRSYVLTMDRGIAELKKAGYKEAYNDHSNICGHSYYIIKKGEQFKVSELTAPFLNPRTRSTETKPYYLLRLEYLICN